MTDRIMELRALLDDYDGNGIFVTTAADVGALLDCAEALAAVTAALEWQAHGRCRTTYYDGPILPAAEAVERGVAALAKLNGDSNG